MKRLFSFLIFAAIILGAVQSRAQYLISGTGNVFSNSQVTASVPVTTYIGSPQVATFVTPMHTLSITHGGLLATTNFSCSAQVGIVDAITGQTNWINIAQVWTATTTNSATESLVTLTNYSFNLQGRLILTTTNAMNLPNGPGAASYVTNTIIFN